MAALHELPDPAEAGSLDQLVERLRLLKIWAGDPSYETIKGRVNATRPPGDATARTTVAACFRAGRRRNNPELLVAVVEALHPDRGYVNQWRQALRVVGGETEAAARVRVRDALPPDLPGFTGRSAEIDRLRQARRRGEAVVLSAIEGMAGVGKTKLAVHAGHLLHREEPFERVLFVNLRGFHDDPAQPPADPSAVLDGFLRLLGVPGQRIPHDLRARAAMYRERLAGCRALVVLDNAASAEQARPLLPPARGCFTLLTSRRRLAGLGRGVRLPIGVFGEGEAADFLAAAAPGVAVGPDPEAARRIARRCGHLPLALGLVAAHIRNVPGWTLTDHADRLDERHLARRLDTGVELALRLSCRNLAPDDRRTFRRAALHPGQDFDRYAVAALTGSDPNTSLERLCADNLLQPSGSDRYAFHDLVRTYAAGLVHDEDPPAERRAALTRLFDHYVATSATAARVLRLDESYMRPVAGPVRTAVPGLETAAKALAWLEVEQANLIAVVAHAAEQGRPDHTAALARILLPYLSGRQNTDALTVHRHAYDAARRAGDMGGLAQASWGMGIALVQLGRLDEAGEQYGKALDWFRRAGDVAGQARATHSLGNLAQRRGDFPAATERYESALVLHRRAGDLAGQGRAWHGLGMVAERVRDYESALGRYHRSLRLYRRAGDLSGQADALNGLGDVEVVLDRPADAEKHLREALALHRGLGDRACEAEVLGSLGQLQTGLGRPEEGAVLHRRAFGLCREAGDRDGEMWALNGLGEAYLSAGRPGEARTHLSAAAAIAAEMGARDQLARAHAGLGQAHRLLGDAGRERVHRERAADLYAELGVTR
ncbi:tetratricopeptide repeat protein [Actinoplanes sp. NPDC049596]|uniref:ATP-binding protein n=1 Tax=unclassified Actinoplanes TaxID=2626549 RepID=UPI003442E15F